MSSYPGILTLGSALRSPSEEYIGAGTHGLGLALSLLGSVALMSQVLVTGDAFVIFGTAFYCAALVGVYAASTLSHMYFSERWNRLFRALDQGLIYLLIVGTFTPFAMKYLTSPGWLAFYGLIVAVAVGGCLSKTVFSHQLQGVSVWLYVAIGWGEAAAIYPMLGTIPAQAVYGVIAGGAFYSIGTIFLVLDIRKYHFHAIWHVLVICGSICHFWAIYQFVALAR